MSHFSRETQRSDPALGWTGRNGGVVSLFTSRQIETEKLTGWQYEADLCGDRILLHPDSKSVHENTHTHTHTRARVKPGLWIEQCQFSSFGIILAFCDISPPAETT